MDSNTINEIKSAPGTFTSWDACMSKGYCKWPAIIGIIIGVVIAVSIIWCCVRCCCCGMSCCCGCFSCFNRCCPGGRGKKRSKYADPQAPYPQPNPYMGYVPPTNPPSYNGPNTATFDHSRPTNPDSLPSMPTWKDAKLEDSHRSDVEMGNLNQQSQATGIVPLAGSRSSKGGYSELPHHDDSYAHQQQPSHYRGASTTDPYGSDLGAQPMLAHDNNAYDPPRVSPMTPSFNPAPAPSFDPAPMPYSSGPSSYQHSSPPQPTYTAYSPNTGGSPNDNRPPSLLQIGKRPGGVPY